MKTYITNDIAILDSTRTEHAVTLNTDANGYLIQNGTDVVLCTARDEEGNLYIYAETNGDPILLCEGKEMDFAKTIGDNADWESGMERLAELATKLDEDNADWIAERIEVIKSEAEQCA